MNGYVRKYRIKSAPRFTAFLVIAALAVFIALGIIAGPAESTAESVEEYTTYTVSSGDTLWSIANDYKTDSTDTRKAVYEIEKINGVQPEDLQPDMQLKIPVDL